MSSKYTSESAKDSVLGKCSNSNSHSVADANPDAFIGIDFHKRYSVFHVVDADGKDLAKGRIEHHSPQEFRNYSAPVAKHCGVPSTALRMVSMMLRPCLRAVAR